MRPLVGESIARATLDKPCQTVRRLVHCSLHGLIHHTFPLREGRIVVVIVVVVALNLLDCVAWWCTRHGHLASMNATRGQVVDLRDATAVGRYQVLTGTSLLIPLWRTWKLNEHILVLVVIALRMKGIICTVVIISEALLLITLRHSPLIQLIDLVLLAHDHRLELLHKLPLILHELLCQHLLIAVRFRLLRVLQLPLELSLVAPQLLLLSQRVLQLPLQLAYPVLVEVVLTL